MRNMVFEITIEQMAFFTTAVVERDRLLRKLYNTQSALTRKKDELRRYQKHCEEAKSVSDRAEGGAAQDGERTTASVAGATVEPQHNEPNADAKTDMVLFTDGTEVRISVGVRAGIDAGYEDGCGEGGANRDSKRTTTSEETAR